jgi:hypothetical protein
MEKECKVDYCVLCSKEWPMRDLLATTIGGVCPNCFEKVDKGEKTVDQLEKEQ